MGLIRNVLFILMAAKLLLAANLSPIKVSQLSTIDDTDFDEESGSTSGQEVASKTVVNKTLGKNEFDVKTDLLLEQRPDVFGEVEDESSLIPLNSLFDGIDDLQNDLIDEMVDLSLKFDENVFGEVEDESFFIPRNTTMTDSEEPETTTQLQFISKRIFPSIIVVPQESNANILSASYVLLMFSSFILLIY